MRQLLYISSSKSGDVPCDVAPIFRQSRRNNERAGVTGLLYTDGRRFLQVLEGPAEAVEVTYSRIAADPRHRAIVILSDRAIATREFGNWSMAHRDPSDCADALDDEMRRLLRDASPSLSGTFLGLVAARRSA